MEKKYIKIIKHLYKNLQKKDEFKNEFEKTSNSIFLYSSVIFFTPFFVFFSFILGIGISELLASLFSGVVLGYMLSGLIIFIFEINIFNNLVSKKLSKYNLFNLYSGRSSNFSDFLYTIIQKIIQNTEKEDLKFYTKEITHIINSIPDGAIKNNIKMKFIEKMEIDIDSQLTNLTEDKRQEENLIKIDSKSLVVNS